MDASYVISVYLEEQFQRRRFLESFIIIVQTSFFIINAHALIVIILIKV
jgi:hypothetical protein